MVFFFCLMIFCLAMDHMCVLLFYVFFFFSCIPPFLFSFFFFFPFFLFFFCLCCLSFIVFIFVFFLSMSLPFSKIAWHAAFFPPCCCCCGVGLRLGSFCCVPQNYQCRLPGQRAPASRASIHLPLTVLPRPTARPSRIRSHSFSGDSTVSGRSRLPCSSPPGCFSDSVTSQWMWRLTPIISDLLFAGSVIRICVTLFLCLSSVSSGPVSEFFFFKL